MSDEPYSGGVNANPAVVEDMKIPITTAAVTIFLFVIIIIPLDLLSPIWSGKRNLGIRRD
jgi:hypothetical protein